jgi:hypothetical protein
MQTQTVAIPKFPVVQKSLHAELKRRVNQYLEEQTIRGTGNYKLFTKAVILISLFFLTLVAGCQTIKNKTDAIVEKENAKLSEYIGKTSSNLQMELGKPDEDFKNDKGNLELVYNTKKYGILCERRFEVDSNSIVIGFVSNGCF